MTKETVIKLDNFLKYLTQNGNVSKSAKKANIDRSYIYQLRKDDIEFSKKMIDARSIAFDLLEEEALKRALEGVNQKVYYKGEVVDSVKVYSDKLLLALLKANNPEKYAENIINRNPDIANLLSKSLMKNKPDDVIKSIDE